MTVMMTRKRMTRIKKMKKRRRTATETTMKTAGCSDTGSVTIWSYGTEQVDKSKLATDIVLRLCYFTVTEDFEDSRSSSSLLVYFSVVRGLPLPSEALH